MNKTLATVCLCFVLSILGKYGLLAQTKGPNDTVKVYAFVTPQGDTIPGEYLPNVTVYTKVHPKWKKFWVEWTRLRNAVYVTFPYALAASKTIKVIEGELAGVSDKHKRREIIHAHERELKKQFGDKVTQLSIYQGKVLMKLIYRQTGNNCFEIIKEYKGGFNAGFWQSVAFLFGSSLKQAYDPEGEDKTMETIVKEVERMYGIRS